MTTIKKNVNHRTANSVFMRLFVLSVCIILVMSAVPTAMAATITLNPGANLAQEIANAAPGTVIKLNDGDYGYQSITGISKTDYVTIQSTNGKNARVILYINNCSKLIFQNLTIYQVINGRTSTKSTLEGTSSNIKFLNNTFTGQLRAWPGGSGNVIDGNTFYGITCPDDELEGRLHIGGGGVAITNNRFGGGGESDGISVGGSGCVIGPGNVFDGIIQGNYDRHCDAVQLYGQDHTTITGNYFINNSDNIMAPDGGESETIINNIFIGTGANGYVALGTHNNTTVRHNTFVNAELTLDRKPENQPSSNSTIQDNIFVKGSWLKIDAVNSTISHNLFDTASTPYGTNNILGNPTFVGGSTPATWAGWQLTASSLGYHAATDGTDMGTVYYGGTTPTPTPTPASTPVPGWYSKTAYSQVQNLGSGNTGTVTIEYDVTPLQSMAAYGGVMGYADTSVTIDNYSKMAMIVRLNPSGNFDVRNGADYAALTTVAYSLNNTYHVRIVANMSAKTYSVWVTSGSQYQIASNYAFRSDAPSTDDAGKVCLMSEGGNDQFRITNHTVAPTATPTPTPTPQWYSKTAYSQVQNLGTGNTGTVTIEYDVVPLQSMSTYGGVTGYADTSVTIDNYSKMAMIVRLNPSGNFDVRNGSDYAALTAVPYSLNTTYHVRIVANMTARTYSVWVTSGGTQYQIASNYAFRSDAPSTDDAGKVCLMSEGGNDQYKIMNHTVLN